MGRMMEWVFCGLVESVWRQYGQTMISPVAAFFVRPGTLSEEP